MSDIMTITLSGRVTREPEISVSQKGTKICKFDLACNSYSNGQSETHFFHILCFSHNAEYIGKYARKGTQMTINGMPTSKSYKDKDGKTRMNTDVIANTISIAISNNTASQSNYNNASYDSSIENDGNFEYFNAGPPLNISSDDLPF